MLLRAIIIVQVHCMCHESACALLQNLCMYSIFTGNRLLNTWVLIDLEKCTVCIHNCRAL